MSWRSDSAQLLVAGWVSSAYAGHGITGAAMRAATATGGSGPGLLYNDWDSAADDGKAFRALITGGAPAGALFYEDGSFTIPAGTADGTYSIGYWLYVDGADMGATTATVTVGSVGAAFNVMPAGLPGAATSGTPTVSFGFTFAVATTGLASTAAVGLPVVSFDIPFGVAPQGLPSGLAFGSATFTMVFGPWIGPSGHYTSTRQLADRIGQGELIQLTNPTDPTATTINAVRMEDAIADIEALIDAKLLPRYALPLATVPRLLSNIAADLLRARLYADRVPESIANREKAALKLLDDIATGKLSLGLDMAAQATPPADGPQFFTTQPVFTPGSLSDFAP